MTDEMISFLTPYWSGREMMRIHLASVRRFYPAAPILVSKRGGEPEEMETHRREFGIRYWLEDCTYEDALLRLFERCETEYACVIDHDTVLLSSLDSLLGGLIDGRYDLVGVEERIREAPKVDWMRLAPDRNGWMRFAPGCADTNFIVFSIRELLAKWGLRGVRGKRPAGAWDYEYPYGICQKLARHKYLLPFHTRKYGPGNLLKDGDTAVLWHQWSGSYRESQAHPEAFDPGISDWVPIVKRGEAAFLTDYPNLDLSHLTPAWGPDWDIRAEQRAAERAYPGFIARSLRRARRWRSYGWRKFAARLFERLDRWRRLF